MEEKKNVELPVYAILGKSGSGKSTVAKMIKDIIDEDEYYSEIRLVKNLDQYTTRPQRTKADTDYTFISRSMFDIIAGTDPVDKVIEKGNIISDISYRTENGVWRYIMRYDDLSIHSHPVVIYATPVSIGQFMDLHKYYTMSKYSDKDLILKPIPVLVEANKDKNRLRALYNRASSDSDYKEIIRRELYGEELLIRFYEMLESMGYDSVIKIENNYIYGDLRKSVEDNLFAHIKSHYGD